MVYCSKCGKKNEDDAEFCNKCGASLIGKKDLEKEWDKRCEEECTSSRHTHSWSLFWGVIIILIGLWIIWEFIIRQIPYENLPESLTWIPDFPFGLVFAAVIGIFIILFGLRLISKG